MIMTSLGALALVTLAAAAPPTQETPPGLMPPAPAVEAVAPSDLGPGGFGDTGQVAIGSDFAIGFDFAAKSGDASVALAPAVDYFLAPRLSVGVQIRGEHLAADAGSRTAFGLGPRVGYVLPLGETFSLFPRLGLAYSHISETIKGPPKIENSGDFLTLFLYAPVQFHPVPHFFVGLGPLLRLDVADENARVGRFQIGLSSTVGGWFPW